MTSDPDVAPLIRMIGQSLQSFSNHFTATELDVIKKEMKYANRLICSPLTINELAYEMVQAAPPIFSDISTCLKRTHEVIGVGCLGSCLSSLSIIKAFESFGLVTATGTSSNFIIGRGHVAPLVYALRYCRNGFPLSMLYATHHGVPGVVRKEFGFSNSMRHSLGDAVAASIGKALFERSQYLDSHIYCFSGDGELNEGICFEAIRLSYEKGLTRYTLVIDDNGRGIERLNKPLNTDYLQAFFDDVHIVNGNNMRDLTVLLEECTSRGLREAIVCKTQKEHHTYHLDKKKLGSSSSSNGIANIIDKLRCTHKVNVVTPDLACRFGLSDGDGYLNAGLSEQASVALLSLLPDHEVKLILTDDKYLLNSLDSLQSTFAFSHNVQLIATRKNAPWGGPVYAPNIFQLLENVEVFELCDLIDLDRLLSKNTTERINSIFIFQDHPQQSIQSFRREYRFMDDYDHYFRFAENSDVLLISTESFAVKVCHISQKLEISHLRLLQRRPKISEALYDMIAHYSIIIVFENNSSSAGVAEYLSNVLQRNIHCIGMNQYDEPAISSIQEQRSGTSVDCLVKKTRELIYV